MSTYYINKMVQEKQYGRTDKAFSFLNNKSEKSKSIFHYLTNFNLTLINSAKLSIVTSEK